MENQIEEIYPCVGICTPDPDSGYCLGCGRPPMASPDIVSELAIPVVPDPKPLAGDPDTPA